MLKSRSGHGNLNIDRSDQSLALLLILFGDRILPFAKCMALLDCHMAMIGMKNNYGRRRPIRSDVEPTSARTIFLYGCNRYQFPEYEETVTCPDRGWYNTSCHQQDSQGPAGRAFPAANADGWPVQKHLSSLHQKWQHRDPKRDWTVCNGR